MLCDIVFKCFYSAVCIIIINRRRKKSTEDGTDERELVLASYLTNVSTKFTLMTLPLFPPKDGLKWYKSSDRKAHSGESDATTDWWCIGWSGWWWSVNGLRMMRTGLSPTHFFKISVPILSLFWWRKDLETFFGLVSGTRWLPEQWVDNEGWMLLRQYN